METKQNKTKCNHEEQINLNVDIYEKENKVFCALCGLKIGEYI